MRQQDANERPAAGSHGAPPRSAGDPVKTVAVATLIVALIAAALLGTILFLHMP